MQKVKLNNGIEMPLLGFGNPGLVGMYSYGPAYWA